MCHTTDNVLIISAVCWSIWVYRSIALYIWYRKEGLWRVSTSFKPLFAVKQPTHRVSVPLLLRAFMFPVKD